MRYLILFCFLLSGSMLSAQVVINELSPKSGALLPDEDGAFPDWIELYNDGAGSVDLLGYSISDKAGKPQKWVFPAVALAPGEFLTLFASGKDRASFSDHWESAVLATDQWRYLVPLSEPNSNWRYPGFNDSGWLLGPGGIGYGDGDDGSVLTPPVTSVYLRREFNIVDLAAISYAVLHMDYDDGFVAYLNGVEIARSNVGQNGTPTPFNAFAFEDHEAIMYTGNLPEAYPFAPVS